MAQQKIKVEGKCPDVGHHIVEFQEVHRINWDAKHGPEIVWREYYGWGRVEYDEWRGVITKLYGDGFCVYKSQE